MTIENAVVLVTGANRGLGETFARLALERGARKVYAAARNADSIRLWGVVPLRLDVTRASHAAAAASAAPDVDLVINNAGIMRPGGITQVQDVDTLREQLETNVFGMLQVAQAFTPVLARNGGGAMVNILSALSWINATTLSGYCVSKAAAWMLTNALRNELRAKGTQVVGVHAGFIDTDMAGGYSGAKVSPAAVVEQTFAALSSGQEEVFADDGARRLHSALSSSVYLQPVPLSRN